ncbi:hypothetical protein [Actinacidiphila alni]|uniref:hypothetical protein n=1 Tax=Actinacidiphila alni TaxID=380248 RepID=UPI003456373E
MASKRQPYWRTIGTPTTLVLYRTVDRWRYAISFTEPSGVADGALNDHLPNPSARHNPANHPGQSTRVTAVRTTGIGYLETAAWPPEQAGQA